MSPRTARLLDAPMVPTLLALAAPNAAVTLLQSGVSVLDAYFVARLGADAGRYSFIVSYFHRLLLAGLPAHFES